MAVTDLPTYAPSDRYTETGGPAFVTGIQALARLPVAQIRADRAAALNTAALTICCGRSPLGDLGRELTLAVHQVPDLPILGRPAVDEELAATAVLGTQLASTESDANYEGVVGFWYGTAAGLGRAGEALRRANAVGTSRYGGAVAVVGDDPAVRGSAPLTGSDLSIIDLGMPLFHPGDVQEVLDLGHHAVMLSRLCGLWTAMRVVGAVGGGSGTVDLAIDRIDPVRPNLEVDGVLHMSVINEALLAPSRPGIETEIRARRLEVARRYGVVNDLNRPTANPRDGWIGVVAAGHTYREVLAALRRLGQASIGHIESAGIRLLCLQMPSPLDPRVVRNFARGLEEIVVVEEYGSSIEWAIKDALYGGEATPSVVGRNDECGAPLVPADKAVTADELVPVLHRRLRPRLADRLVPPPDPDRCAAPSPIAAVPPPSSSRPADAEVVPPGAGGTQWLGMEPFLDRNHTIEDLGDVARFDFGQQAIRAAVAAGVDMTYELSYCDPVADTEPRRPPAAVMAVKELTKVLLTQGVTEVLIIVEKPRRHEGAGLPTSKYGGRTKVWDRVRIGEARRYLATVPGVSVLIHDHGTGSVTRDGASGTATDPGPGLLLIDHRICEACGDCGDVDSSPWLRSIDTPFGIKTAIDRTSAKAGNPAVDGDCPSFVEVEPAPGFDWREVDRARDLPGIALDFAGQETLPEPNPVVPGDRADIRLAGLSADAVAGSAAILGTAALLDGWTVRGVDRRCPAPFPDLTVSDLRLARDEPAPSGLIGCAEAHTVIAFDPSSAAAEPVLVAASPERTVLVASTSETPSVAAARKADHRAPTVAQLRHRAAAAASPGGRHFVDAARFTTAMAGDAAGAEVFLLGAAVQAGAVPLRCQAVERSIELHGGPVVTRLAAFRLGRRWMFNAERGHPEPVPQIGVDPSEPTSADLSLGLARHLADLRLEPGLHDLLAMLTADLIAYQNESYAEHFVDVMTRVVGAERLVASDSTVLSETVGRSLHRLMAYKDEYEVARLLLRPEQRTLVEAVGGPGAKVTWRVRRPWSRTAARSKKVSLNAGRARPLTLLVAKSRWLRGSTLDPFGRGALRRAERSLIGEYTTAVDSALRGLEAANLDATVELAGSAMEVRGYGRLKMASIEAFRERLARGVEVRLP